MKWTRKISEVEANHFAMCILLPKGMLVNELRKRFPNGIDFFEENDQALKEVAKEFRVPVSLLLFRMGQIWNGSDGLARPEVVSVGQK